MTNSQANGPRRQLAGSARTIAGDVDGGELRFRVASTGDIIALLEVRARQLRTAAAPSRSPRRTSTYVPILGST